MAIQQFIPPGRQERANAIGTLEYFPPAVRLLLDPEGFAPIERPRPQDWLASHREPGQTCADFLHSHPNYPDVQRKTIYLQPLEKFEKSRAPPLYQLQAFAEAFFSLRV